MSAGKAERHGYVVRHNPTGLYCANDRGEPAPAGYYVDLPGAFVWFDGDVAIASVELVRDEEPVRVRVRANGTVEVVE